MKNDYRNTKYCKPLSELESKKKTLNDQILKEHPRVKIVYNQVHDSNKPYKTPFMEMYNYKCAYCGNSIANIDIRLFEVDHYIHESSFGDDKSTAGRIENLVLSCYDCNRAKSDFLIEGEYIDKLNPDLDGITDVFYRDENYYIQISDIYDSDLTVKKFYNQLKLDYNTRRLDFLLLNLRGLRDSIKGQTQADKLNSILLKLMEKRNLTKC